MSSIVIPKIDALEFRATVATRGDALELTLVGTADGRAIEPLADLLPKVHANAIEAHAKQVIVDLTGLEFMNSSCFKSVVSWISTVQETPAPYHVQFVSTAQRRWQKRSLHAIACFAPELVSIDVRD